MGRTSEGRKAATIPPHTMQRYATEAIALGLSGQEFGRRNRLSPDQGARLAKVIRLRVEGTARTTPAGAIISTNAAQSLSRLSSRMINALIGQGQRCVEVLEVLNARYEPREVERIVEGEKKRAMEFPEWTSEDIRAARFARDVCWRIISLSRKDGRDLPAGEQGEEHEERNAGPAEPVERRPSGEHHPSALVILDAGTGEPVQISE